MKKVDGKFIIKILKYSIFSDEYEWYYFVTEDDPFHMMAEYLYRSIDRVNEISWSYWTEKGEQFWIEQGARKIQFNRKYYTPGATL